MDSSKTFGTTIREARESMGITAHSLGCRVCPSGQAYRRYERDEVLPSVDVAAKIAKILHLSLAKGVEFSLS